MAQREMPVLLQARRSKFHRSPPRLSLKDTDADMLAIAKNGKGKMPAWHDKLSEDQLKDLVAYIHTLQKKS